jgi:hypothetical protein
LSSGLHGFSSLFIKKSHICLIQLLTFPTNLLLNTGIFPVNLNISNIKPLFKKGAAYEIENYRSVSLISTFLKILEKVLCVRLINFLEKYNIFLESQHSFHNGRSTSTALVNLLEDVYITLGDK